MDNTVVISTPPHVKSRRTTRGIMLDVVIALMPCAVAGIVYFGARAFMIEALAVLSCVGTEFVYYFIFNRGFSDKLKNTGGVCLKWLRQFDLTSVITGLILAMIVSPSVEWYEIILGGIFAVAVVKMLFGGTGKNLVNPAAAARIFLMLSFAVSMAKYVLPAFDSICWDSGSLSSGSTNLSAVLGKNPHSVLEPLDLFLGTGVYGCIGETCKAAIIAGYLYLCVRKVIKWWQPVLFLAVFGAAAVLLSGFAFEGGYRLDVSLFLPHLLSGGVMFAAVFMFPDYVTSPKCVQGQLVYYIAGALLTAALRFFTGMEIASYAILLMNLLVPLIDRHIRPRPFGYKKQRKTEDK